MTNSKKIFKFLVLFSAKSLRTPSNVFIVNLAICDFVMMAKTPIFIYNSFNRGFATGVLGCKIFALLGSFSGIGAGITNVSAHTQTHTF
jgi:r-opsin